MTQEPELERELLAAETRVWEALKRGDAKADAQSLDEDFLGVYPDGMFGRADHVAQLAGGPTVASYALDQVSAFDLGGQFGLLVYRATYLRPGSETEEKMYVSSIWKRTEGRWINTFSQDTPEQRGLSVP